MRRLFNLVFSGGLQPLLVGVLVLGIGVSLGGSTGYAINPLRDLGPRLAHALLPIAGKRDSDWGYAWIPVVGPIIGGVVERSSFERWGSRANALMTAYGGHDGRRPRTAPESGLRASCSEP